ncbi:MAG: PQQ-binding-like beta-propeller repeat protein [Gemmatimonadetes bacterium]|nr:PQQ-binding-like beta-propeller repeat protein [Gemmatimonadota bacterium]
MILSRHTRRLTVAVALATTPAIAHAQQRPATTNVQRPAPAAAQPSVPTAAAPRPITRAPRKPLVAAGPVTPTRLENPLDGEWLQNGRDYANTRYSPLTQITGANIAQLAPRALFQLEMPQAGAGAEATPVVDDGRLFVTTDFDVVTAFDLRSHKRLWRYEPKLGAAKPCCGPVNRGVALGHGTVFLGTLDARLVALDAATGAVRWEAVVADADSAYTITMAPIVIGDRVIVGTSGGEFPTRGSVTAFDVRTGKRLWRWYAIPSPEEGGWWGRWAKTTPAGDSLPRDVAQEHIDSSTYEASWRTGGGPVWAQPAYDAASRTLYVNVGNPAPSNDGRRRPGDNLYTTSVVALDVATGKLRWYFQTVPHDEWDADLANPPVLVRASDRTLVLAAAKTGWVYMIDAATGAYVRRSEPFVPQQNVFQEPTDSGIVVAPGPAGGANWWPSSYSAAADLFYVVGIHMPFKVTRAEKAAQKGEVWLGGEYSPASKDVYSVLSAIKPSTGRIVWQRRIAPYGGGTLATAGGLVFAGEGDGWLRAYDAWTGIEVWSFFCGAGVSGPPISFDLDGEQYIAVIAAGNRYVAQKGSSVLVFALGGSASDPALARAAAARNTRSARAPFTPAMSRDAIAPRKRYIAPPEPDTTEKDPVPASATRSGPFLAYDASTATAWLRIDAAGMSFDGRTGGTGVVVVPFGWRVEVRFRNADAAPHSARVVAPRDPVPLVPGRAVFTGAQTKNADAGILSGDSDHFSFLADRAGTYLIACAVPGHAAAGMYLKLVVSPGVDKPEMR